MSNPDIILSGFGGPEGFGELSQGRNDDGSSSRLSLPFNINFFGQQYTTFFVNNNGNITFAQALGQYTPSPFPIANQPIIAPFWADVDTRPLNAGEVYVAAPNDSTVVITWDGVGYYAVGTDLLNTFQLVLRDRPDTGDGNFDVEFRYGLLEWTTGDASGGSGGLGGTPAQAGFDAGDGAHFLELTGSRTAAALDWDDLSNVTPATPGLWTFAIRSGVTPGTTPENPLLPIVVDGTFEFDFNIVDFTEPVFIDPEVAVGYDYAISSGPMVTRVLLPTGIGDNLFDLWQYDANVGSLVDTGIDLTGGVWYDFAAPTDQFGIRGIEVDAMLDPEDPLAFVTGLEFEGNGASSLSMTPVRVNTDALLSIDAVDDSVIEGDSGTTAYQFEVTRSGYLDQQTTVAYQVAGTGGDPADAADFATPMSGSVTFLPGETTATITLEVAGDTQYEADETFRVQLSSPQNGIVDVGSASGSIINDDSATFFDVTIRFASEEAWYRNSFGIYDASTGRASLLEGNVDVRSNPDVRDFATTLRLTQEELADLRFFLIPDGQRLNGGLVSDPDALDLRIEWSNGHYRLHDLASDQFLRGAGAPAWFSDATMNVDDQDHTQEVGSSSSFELRWEDQRNLGDDDFNDAVFQVDVTAVGTDPLFA